MKKIDKKLRLVLMALIIILFIPSKILHYVSISLILIIAYSFFYSMYLRKRIVVERTATTLKLACKERVDIYYTIKNYSRFTAYSLYCFDDNPYLYVFNEGNKTLITLRPFESKQLKYKISAQERGRYQIGPVKIKCSDPLNLFPFNIEIQSNIEVIVRPARLKLITKTMPGFPQGNLPINNICYEDITRRRSVREYQNGDEQKRINWRASAKFGDLFTNQFEDSYDAPFFVFLNIAEEDYELNIREYYIEKAIEIAACIVERSRYLRQRCGFAAYAQDFPYLQTNVNHADAILDILSTIKKAPGKLDYDPIKKFKNQLPAGTLLFVIGPEEVRKYFSMVEKNRENINTENVGIIHMTKIASYE